MAYNPQTLYSIPVNRISSSCPPMVTGMVPTPITFKTRMSVSKIALNPNLGMTAAQPAAKRPLGHCSVPANYNRPPRRLKATPLLCKAMCLLYKAQPLICKSKLRRSNKKPLLMAAPVGLPGHPLDLAPGPLRELIVANANTIQLQLLGLLGATQQVALQIAVVQLILLERCGQAIKLPANTQRLPLLCQPALAPIKINLRRVHGQAQQSPVLMARL